MTDSLYLRLKTLNVRTMRGVTSPKSVIRVAAMHNLREIQAEPGAGAASGINPALMHLNYLLRGPDTAASVADLALALLDNAGVKNLRRDACMALELVFSLPPATAIDHREYFAAAVAWADTHFNAPILSATVHLDESAPHCHVLMLPLVAGRMQGGALAGGPSKIRMMQSDFQQQVGQRFGLAHQPRAKRLSRANMTTAGRMVVEALQACPERLNDAAVRDALAAALGQHHETLFPLLGLVLPAPAKTKAKSFADIMTAPCKSERGDRARKSIDVAGVESKSIDVGPGGSSGTAQENVQRLSCVDVAPSSAPISAHGVASPEPTSLTDGSHPVHLTVSEAVQHLDTQPTEDSLKTEPTTGASIEAPDSVFSAQPAPATGEVVKRQPAIDALPGDVHELDAMPASSTATPDKTGKPGNAAAPGGRAAKSKVRFSDFDTATTARCSDVSITVHEVDQADALISASLAPAAASNRQWGANLPDGFQRQRDTDYPATCWDSERGEFAPITGPPGAMHRHPE